MSTVTISMARFRKLLKDEAVLDLIFEHPQAFLAHADDATPPPSRDRNTPMNPTHAARYRINHALGAIGIDSDLDARALDAMDNDGATERYAY